MEAVALLGAWRLERLDLENGDALMAFFAEESSLLWQIWLLMPGLASI